MPIWAQTWMSSSGRRGGIASRDNRMDRGRSHSRTYEPILDGKGERKEGVGEVGVVERE